MRVIVVGCGRVGSALAYQLYRQGHNVTVIDQDANSFDDLPEDFRGRTVRGDVLVRNVLHRAEIEKTDALIAATSSDSLNALVAYIAREEFRIPKVVARNYDPAQRPLQEAFGIPVAVSSNTGTRHIEDMLLETPLRVLSLDSNTGLGLYQLQVPARWNEHLLQDLLQDVEVKVIAWTRGVQPVEVSSLQPMQPGDLILISAGQEAAAALNRRLNSFEEHSQP